VELVSGSGAKNIVDALANMGVTGPCLMDPLRGLKWPRQSKEHRPPQKKFWGGFLMSPLGQALTF
jgi:hypothetical protein